MTNAGASKSGARHMTDTAVASIRPRHQGLQIWYQAHGRTHRTFASIRPCTAECLSPVCSAEAKMSKAALKSTNAFADKILAYKINLVTMESSI